MMKTITIKGKDYPLRITMGAMVRFKRITGKDVSQVGEGDAIELFQFLYCCLVSACKADGIEFNYDFEEFADIMDISMLDQAASLLDNPEKKSIPKA